MNINKYAPFFHDGRVLDIKHDKKSIQIFMESAELQPEWNEDNVILTKHNTIKGILTISKIYSVKIDDKSFLGNLHKIYDSGGISDLEVKNKEIKLLVYWRKYSPKYENTDIYTYVIEGEKIIWENLPNS